MGLTLYGINELTSLSADSIISINKVEFWLLKYQDDYNYLKSLREGELPPLSNSVTPEDKFVYLYKQLDKVSRLHRFEPYSKEQLETYALIKNDTLKLKNWLNINESFYYEELIHFSINYLNYLGNGKEYHLNVFSYPNEDLGLYVKGEDFDSIRELEELIRLNIG
ncbi:MAG: hypothetical protein GYB35_09260 [Algicola sp.]|nr:hypothetical protein [Algicola sp.]